MHGPLGRTRIKEAAKSPSSKHGLASMSISAVRSVTLLLTLATALGASSVGALGQEAAAPGGGPDTLSTVTGAVTDHENGKPVAGAVVSLQMSAEESHAMRTTNTDDEGRFRFPDVGPGAYRLSVTRLGYHSLEDSVAVPPAAEVRVEAKLSTSPLDLEPIVVVVRSRGQSVVPGLAGRRQRGPGTFILRDRIEASKAKHVSELLRLAPGVQLVPEGDLGYSIRLRHGCRPSIWIDDARTTSVDIDGLLLPSDIEAIEVYHAGEMPPRFGLDTCGAVVFWTRTRQPGTGKTSAWKRILLSTAVLAGMLLVRVH